MQHGQTGRARSIRQKLSLILVASVGLALLLAGASLLLVEAREAWRDAQADVAAQADVVGLASEAALAFGDPAAAEQNLRVLRAQGGVAAAALYDKNGKLFARFRAAGARDARIPGLAPPAGVHFDLQDATIVRPVLSNREVIGSVYVLSRHGLVAKMAEYVVWLLGVTLVSLLGALLLANRLRQRRRANGAGTRHVRRARHPVH